MNNARLLFIPVSSISGIGEYNRSLIIAKAIKEKWPNCEIHFILNADVPYFSSCPFAVHPCQGSATKDTKSVNRFIEEIKPNLVIFDASGRAQQFKKAKEVGAKVAFISQHKKKRSRGLKLNRLLNTDIHWVVQPDYCIEPLSWFQKTKLALFNRPSPKNVGAVYSVISESFTKQTLKKFNLICDEYFVFNAGSGGHKSKEGLAADIYYQAAIDFYQQTQMPCVMVFGDNYPKDIPINSESNDNTAKNQTSGVVCMKSVDNNEFIALLTSAKGRVISAGDTILQCIDLAKVSVAAAVSKDQPKRLAACAKQQLLIQAHLSREDLLHQALMSMDKDKSAKIIANMNKYVKLNALDQIINDIERVISKKNDN